MLAQQVREIIAGIDARYPSDSDRRRAYAEIAIAVGNLPDRPSDPFSVEYREWVLQCFEAIRGEAYTTTTEGLPIDIAWEVDNAFPYGTRDPFVMGSFMVAFGWLVRELGLPPNARILEVGAGLGSLTAALSRCGYDVTALEINKTNADVIRLSTAHLAKRPVVISENASAFRAEAESYDCIVFFESFHHLLDHAEILERAKSWLKPGGKIAFAAEPISGDIVQPWGLRTDGESLRAIALWGWLELGFSPSYFETMLDRLGFDWRHTNSPASNWATAYIATVK